MAKKIELDNKEISALYISGKSSCEIGDMMGVSFATVLDRLNVEGVKIRDASNCKQSPCGIFVAERTYRDKDWLEYQYNVLGRTQQEIADECGATRKCVFSAMKRFNIKTRDRGLISHLRQKNQVSLTKRVIEFITGELLGDGTIEISSNYAARYTHVNKHKKYMEWLSGKLLLSGIERTGVLCKKVMDQYKNPCVSYGYGSRSYPEFLPIAKKWYPSGIKIVPRDLCLSPLIARQWFLGDGGLHHHSDARTNIDLHTNGFSKADVLFLVEKLLEIGVVSVRQPSRNTIRINADNAIKFLDYIGPCPEEIWSCYGYKWDLTRSKKEWEAEFCPTAA